MTKLTVKGLTIWEIIQGITMKKSGKSGVILATLQSIRRCDLKKRAARWRVGDGI
ncbi:hypothetical protein ACIPSR_11420 [Pectobacterium sp. CHL-2024]|uniref:hypothetical protein n=1 Tax=Pectobacterium TaxID=122277 RepID=UPI0012FD9064|nr:hypothetical protein [Pectobacterium brasiliense]MBA0210684.1 hypothetical protein [Pectobacterium brasiliense]MCA6984812.1 hypothetical protein [Pectobacterium brasiliense]MCH4994345.1 hypothetical protein [Pectobacterium brasiliense]